MEIGVIFIYALISVISCVLLVVTYLSYKKHQNIKLLFVSCVFFLFFIRGILLSIGLFNEQLRMITSSGYFWIVDLLMLLFLYVSYSFKR